MITTKASKNKTIRLPSRNTLVFYIILVLSFVYVVFVLSFNDNSSFTAQSKSSWSVIESTTTSQRRKSDDFKPDIKAISKISRGIQYQNSSLSKPYFILHIGPHKTGTTTLQKVLGDYRKELELDHFVDLEGKRKKSKGSLLGSCLRGAERAKNAAYGDKKCEDKQEWSVFLQKMKDIEETSNNSIIVSDEGFAKIVDIDYGLKLLKDYLGDRYHVKVIIAYRRYFEWLPSWYNQIHRPMLQQYRLWPSEPDGIEIPTYLDFQEKVLSKTLGDLGREEKVFRPYFPLSKSQPLLHPTQKLRNNFSPYFPDISILNMHDQETDIITNFLCKILPNANNSCSTWLKNKAAGEKEERIQNQSEPMEYAILTTEANKLFKYDVAGKMRRNIEMRIKAYNEETLNLKPSDFPLKCLTEVQSAEFLNISMEFEEELFPSISSADTDDHRASFQRAIDNNKFCSIDIEKVFNDKTWNNFLSKM